MEKVKTRKVSFNTAELGNRNTKQQVEFQRRVLRLPAISISPTLDNLGKLGIQLKQQTSMRLGVSWYESINQVWMLIVKSREMRVHER